MDFRDVKKLAKDAFASKYGVFAVIVFCVVVGGIILSFVESIAGISDWFFGDNGFFYSGWWPLLLALTVVVFVYFAFKHAVTGYEKAEINAAKKFNELMQDRDKLFTKALETIESNGLVAEKFYRVHLFTQAHKELVECQNAIKSTFDALELRYMALNDDEVELPQDFQRLKQCYNESRDRLIAILECYSEGGEKVRDGIYGKGVCLPEDGDGIAKGVCARYKKEHYELALDNLRVNRGTRARITYIGQQANKSLFQSLPKPH